MVQIEFDWLVQLANLRLDIIWKSHVWKSHSLLDYLIQLVHRTGSVSDLDLSYQFHHQHHVCIIKFDWPVRLMWPMDNGELR